MSVVFDLKNSTETWADSVNSALAEDWPEYINTYGNVGSEMWWNNYESGLIPSSQVTGTVSFIGRRKDFFNEEWDIVEINQEGEIAEFDRTGYWESEEIVIGAKVIIESFEISFQQKYGPMKYNFLRLVQVIETYKMRSEADEL